MNADATFQCGGCAKNYKWKPELAGKKVRCKCGQIIDVPTGVATDPPSDQGMYDLAPDTEPSVPSRAGRIMAGSLANAGPAVAAAVPMAMPVLPYQRPGAVGSPPGRRQSHGDMLNQIGDPIKDLYVPIGLMLIGVVLAYVHFLAQRRASFSSATVYIFGTTIVNLVFIFLGLMVAVKWMDLSLGPIGTAAIKIVGVAVFPNSLSLILGGLGFAGAGFIGWSVSLIAIYSLLTYFFEMDLMEAIITDCIIWAIQNFVGMIIFAALLGAFGGGQGLLSPGGGGGGVGNTAVVRVLANDTAADGDGGMYAGEEGVMEGMAFAAQADHLLAGLDASETGKIISGLYSNQARRIVMSRIGRDDDGATAKVMVVELPKDPAGQKQLMSWINSRMSKQAQDVRIKVRQGKTFVVITAEALLGKASED